MPGPAWMNRYSLQNLLGDEAGSDPAAASAKLQSLMSLRSRKLGQQPTSPLGESAPGFYDDMAAINQGVAALGQVAGGRKGLTFAPDRGRVSTMNPLQAGYNAERLADARGDAAGDLQASRTLDALNVGNARLDEREMADPEFGNVAGAKARYNAGASRRLAALGRMGSY